MRPPRPPGYAGGGARLYDVVSGERSVYRAGPLVGIEQLRLRPGHRVLDVGCGTGLNLPVLLDVVGPSGAVVGVDVNRAMLDRARARAVQHRWGNVDLVETDAARLGDALSASSSPTWFDAALFAYALSIIQGWREAFAQTLATLRPGGRIAVVDMALPVGRWRVFSPLARMACWIGGADIARVPWQLVAQTTTVPTHRVVCGGHIHVAASTGS